MLGRVFGLFGTAAFAGSTLAYVLAGVLLDATSPRATFIVGGAGAIASVLLIGPLLWRAIHQISDPAPSP
jgi:MFS family permease